MYWIQVQSRQATGFFAWQFSSCPLAGYRYFTISYDKIAAARQSTRELTVWCKHGVGTKHNHAMPHFKYSK